MEYQHQCFPECQVKNKNLKHWELNGGWSTLRPRERA